MLCIGVGIGHQEITAAGCQVQFSIQKKKREVIVLRQDLKVSTLPIHADLTKHSSSSNEI